MPTLPGLLAAANAAHDGSGRSTTPYVVGAVVIAILSVALAVQLNRRMKRDRRRD
jgi:hypothetical protein